MLGATLQNLLVRADWCSEFVRRRSKACGLRIIRRSFRYACTSELLSNWLLTIYSVLTRIESRSQNANSRTTYSMPVMKKNKEPL